MGKCYPKNHFPSSECLGWFGLTIGENGNKTDCFFLTHPHRPFSPFHPIGMGFKKREVRYMELDKRLIGLLVFLVAIGGGIAPSFAQSTGSTPVSVGVASNEAMTVTGSLAWVNLIPGVASAVQTIDVANTGNVAFSVIKVKGVNFSPSQLNLDSLKFKDADNLDNSISTSDKFAINGGQNGAIPGTHKVKDFWEIPNADAPPGTYTTTLTWTGFTA